MEPDRPIWFLGPGAMPIPAAPKSKKKSKPKPPSGVTYWCREGDATWRPIDTFLAPTILPPVEEPSR